MDPASRHRVLNTCIWSFENRKMQRYIYAQQLRAKEVATALKPPWKQQS